MIFNADFWWTSFTLLFTGFAFWLVIFLGVWSVGFIIDLVKKSIK